MFRVVALPALLLALVPYGRRSSRCRGRRRRSSRRVASGTKAVPCRCRICGCSRCRTGASEGGRAAGQLVVNKRAARPLARVFRRLYQLHFPIRHLRFDDAYGPRGSRPRDGDVSGSFECRQAVPSPCTGGKGTGSWSMHAYGLAVDLNPRENPYVGCGQSRDPAARRYRDRSRHRRGMVTRRVVAASLDRLGLGRLVDRQHQGLHALLFVGALARPSRPPSRSMTRAEGA